MAEFWEQRLRDAIGTPRLSGTLSDDIAAAFREIDRLREDARRFYCADGSSALMDSAEEVVRERVNAARATVELAAQRGELLAACKELIAVNYDYDGDEAKWRRRLEQAEIAAAAACARAEGREPSPEPPP